jgi:predicted RNA-binding Zn-ribbon protein involved in translation (DUF1610 family)
MDLCVNTLDLLEAALFGEKPAEAAPRCASCGKELQEGWKACPHCGAAVQQAIEKQPYYEKIHAVLDQYRNKIENLKHCASCGKEVQEGWKACPECGTPVRAAQALEVPSTPAAAPVSPLVQQPYRQPPPEPVPPPVRQPYQQPAPYQPPVSMIRKRSLASLIVLSIITFGIYSLYWIYQLAKDVNALCGGDGKKTAGLLRYFLFNLITLGVYSWVWLYKLGNRLQDNAHRYSRTFTEGGGTVLLWLIPGSFIIVGPFIAWYIIIKNANALADDYNKRHAV